MSFHTLTELQYSEDHEGPWQIYCFNHNGYHLGGKWFSKTMKYPDEEITIDRAYRMAIEAIADVREVRVCDGGDNLVFHSKDGKILFGETFWEDIGAHRSEN